MLSAQFGVSIFGVAATVAAFMLGLGAGSLLALGQPSAGAARALKTFSLLELTVALYALGWPVLSDAAQPLIESLAPHLPWWQWYATQGTVALLLLALPAAAMGASFPVVLRAIPWSPERLGRIYAINCVGAAAGALLSLVLLAAMGWAAALRSVASGGILVAVAAWLLAIRAASQPLEAAQRPVRARASWARPSTAWLLAYAAVGACALMLEMAWTRLYGIVMLRTEYVLAIILAVYLLGTATGSLLAARAHHARWLRTAVPLVACGCTLLGLWSLPAFSVWMQQQHYGSLWTALASQALALGVCTLPTTIALGAWLPVLAHRLPPASRNHAGAVALYSANCLGAALGAVFTVLVGIPLLGSVASVGLAAVLLLALGLALDGPRSLSAAIPVALLAAWLLREFPEPRRLFPQSGEFAQQLERYEDALTLNHVTQANDGQRTLLTDLQHMDASSDPAAVQIQADQARLPLLLHRAPRSVLFLGLGTGISAGGSFGYPKLERTAVELSPGAITAAQTWFAPVNHDITRNMRVVHDDARHFLAASPERYDVIVGDLFHPDLAGMSNLLSTEQFARAREHLAAGGIFAQWIALNQFDRESLHVVLRSFQRVFPDARIFLDGMHLAMVGCAQALPIAASVAANLSSLTQAQADAATGTEGAATWLGRYWGPIAAGVGPVQSETYPIIEFRLPHLRYEEPSPLAEILEELLRRRPNEATASAQLAIQASERTSFANAYEASELAVQSWLALLASDTTHARQLTRLGFEANPRDRWIASALADELFDVAAHDQALQQRGVLERILRIYPDHVETLRALWRLDHSAGRPDAFAALQRLCAVAPLDQEIVESCNQRRTARLE